MNRWTKAVTTSVALMLLVSSCGGSESDDGSTPTPAPAATSARASSADFCQATSEVNGLMVLSAVSGMAGEGVQELYILTKAPEMAEITSRLSASAPPEHAKEAAALATFYRRLSELAASRGLAAEDLKQVGADLDSDRVTAEELFSEIGITVEDLDAIFAEAQNATGGMDLDFKLLGAGPADIGCATAVAAIDPCDLLLDTELSPIIGTEYTSETTQIDGGGASCDIRSPEGAYVHITIGGPTFYQPAMWSEVEMIEGVGDEAFLAEASRWPTLYAKQGGVVLYFSVSNIDPALNIDELVDLMRPMLERAIG